ncbi:ADP-ribosylation factor 3 [Paramuricea clavata]|uniref:ADP-ribosylation factor 3 n=1 Tax=Paramuricea clavata TaxID=317549 RepID=A0A6S7FQA2_PARCT|nr:ADP-ribosylation factor 3 [Paramuricea clavata]
MGLYTWFRDLGSYQKTSVIIGSCALFCGTGYCVYKLYSRKRKVELYDESPNNGQEHKPAVQKRVLVLGLQGCGKTTFLTALANLGSGAGGNETKPTEGFNVMCVTTNGVHLNIWEIGGGEKVQNYWSKFTADTDLLMYMVDSCDAEHFTEAKEKLNELLKDPCLQNVPLLILASKQDKTGARSISVLQKILDVDGLLDTRCVECFGIQISPLGPELQGIEIVQNSILKFCTET